MISIHLSRRSRLDQPALADGWAGRQIFSKTMGTIMRILIIALFLGVWGSGANAQTLKSGDSLSISVLQDSKLDRNVVVDPSGEIAFPLAGHACAPGLSPHALENILEATLKGKYKEGKLCVTGAVAKNPSRT